MSTYTIHVAQYVRCYGTVTVEAESPEAAAASLDAATVAERFTPYGDGEDMDRLNTRDVHLSDWDDEEGRSGSLGLDLADDDDGDAPASTTVGDGT